MFDFLKKRKVKKKMKQQEKDLKNEILSLYTYYVNQDPAYKWAMIGNNYYKGDNEILNRQIYRSVDGVKSVDLDVPNNKLSHPFMKSLVDQKVDYALAKQPKITCKDENYLEWFEEWAEENGFFHQLKYGDTLSSNNGSAWYHPYINENGEFKVALIPATQIIPIWEDDLKTSLKACIRVYQQNQAQLFDSEPVLKINIRCI